MNNFFKGMLVGVGIGLLVAPMKGEEMRRLVSERTNELRGYLPENEQLTVYKQQISDRVSHTADNLKGYAQQASSTLQHTAGNLKNIGQNAASDVKSTGQDVASTSKEAVRSAKNSNTYGSTLDNTNY
ncbi:hypothetical protein KSD_10170 [Ktedonobacter sp. SOSP1-85]|uniref:YtxH domain-containing protein n=1 Tax=Ktedonobacter sp. SOSP1-85 TaxID=2778367 RepID=UPI00191636E4|nr:YtxH domain-containing protein [Ktedonobacter sp. SOSP1-85]GHO73246.1 hypothetical protein KSD_10170 [Ktedonobacter sp. SOSP1-85]